MKSTNLDLEVFSNCSKTQKMVRISNFIEVRNLYPDAKEDNRMNNFSKKERNDTMNSIFEDQEFKQYLETRCNRNNINNHGNTNKEYRSRIISLWQKREQLLAEICNRNTPLPKTITLLFFDTIAATSFPSYYSEKYYYKSFLYPI